MVIIIILCLIANVHHHHGILSYENYCPNTSTYSLTNGEKRERKLFTCVANWILDTHTINEKLTSVKTLSKGNHSF